jgi:hypothetical protein
VLRLADVLAFINPDPSLRDALALKGGTAINLTADFRVGGVRFYVVACGLG